MNRNIILFLLSCVGLVLLFGCLQPVSELETNQSNVTADNTLPEDSLEWTTYSNLGIEFDYPKTMSFKEYPSKSYGTIVLQESFATYLSAIFLAYIDTSVLENSYDDPLESAKAILSGDNLGDDPLGMLHKAQTKSQISSYYSQNGLAVAEMSFQATENGGTLYGYALEIYDQDSGYGYAVRILSTDQQTPDIVKSKFVSSFKIIETQNQDNQTQTENDETAANTDTDNSQNNTLIVPNKEESTNTQNYVCRDGDLGIVPNAPSHVILGSERYDDICEDVAYTDYYNRKDVLREYYCDGNNIASILIDCDCSGGRCQDNQCYTRLFGVNTRINGMTVYNGEFYPDQCAGSTHVTQYYCYKDRLQNHTYNCQEGEICFEGECVSFEFMQTYNGEKTDCTDSDETDEVTLGTVTNNGQNFSDYCIDEDTVKEYACVGGKVSFFIKDCPAGSSHKCTNGICGAENCNNKRVSCTGIRNIYSRSSVIVDNVIYTDYCMDDKTLIEYECNETGNQVWPLEIDCTEKGLACNWGKCTSN
ncbi:MAG: hypothetical protein ABIJ10_03825 [Candidatus Micrarchaeota archaeon]